MKKYRLAYYRDLLALTPYVDYVYRFEHEKEEVCTLRDGRADS